MVSAPYHTVKNIAKNVANLLYNSIVKSALVEGWNENTMEYTSGVLANISVPEGTGNRGMVTLSEYPSFQWRDKLVIRQTANAYFNPPDQVKHEKINVGIHLHTILSRIRYAHELPDAMEGLVREGLITTADKPFLAEQLEALFQIPQVAFWFATGWDVRTEIPILLPDGSENRIDRLLIKEKHAIIIDFKTGEPTKADQRQIESYIAILHKMNFHQVEGYLLYIRHHQIVSVSPGKAKMTRRRDENQISLDF
jgi:hypothetical protein